MKTKTTKTKIDQAYKKLALAGKVVGTSEVLITPQNLAQRLVLKTKRGEVAVGFGPLAYAKIRRIKRSAQQRAFGKEDATGFELVIRI